MNVRPPALPLAAPSGERDPKAIDKAARALEGEFARMMIRAMRQTGLGEEALFPGAAGHYRDLHDAELAKAITQGRGLGLADVIRRQLGAPAKTAPAAPSSGALGVDVAAPVPLGMPQPPAAPKPPTVPGASPAWPKTDDWQATPRQVAETAKAARTSASRAEQFVAEIWPLARQAAEQLSVDPKTLVAQAALETGWGRRPIRTADGADAHNLFGIKATGWTGERARTRTTEYVDGQARRETAEFRAYGSAAESFADYVRMLSSNPRYAEALRAGKDGRKFAEALQKAGYATDPHYAAKLIAIAEGPTLQRALAQR